MKSKLFVICCLSIVWSTSFVAQSLSVRAGEVELTTVDYKVATSGITGTSLLQIPGYFVWGGSVVKGDDGKYHMLFSMWESGPDKLQFTKTWVLESKIGYAVSDRPDGGFKFQKIILKGRRYENDTISWDAQSVHNPHLKKFKDRYYLYYSGSKDPGIQPKGSTGENLDKRARVQQSQLVGVVDFKSFKDLVNGKYNRSKKPLLIARTRVKSANVVNGSPNGTLAKPDNLIVVNPSVIYHPNRKKYMLYFKGNLYDPVWKGAHGVALSDTPTGPFKPLDEFMFDIRLEDGTIASTEDPYVWYAPKYKKVMAVVKDFSGRLTGIKKTLALLSSEDGIHWNTTGNSLFMKRELNLVNGETISVNRLERPQLLINKDGIPEILYAACALVDVNPRNDGSSFNVQIPLLINNE